MYDVEIIIGSTNDQPKVEESDMLEIFKAMGVTYRVSVLSAHRHRQELGEHCQTTLKYTLVYIGIAGMSAHLPGAIAANTDRRIPTLGVALSSEKNPHYFAAARDSMICMPSGVPLSYLGSDKPGLNNAALFACQIIALNNNNVRKKLSTWLNENTAPSQIGVLASNDPQQPQR